MRSGMESKLTSESDEEYEDPPLFSLATLGLQRVGTAPPPKPQPQQPKQILNARGMPARIRKRNRLFFDDNIINDDKPLRMSLSPRKTPLKSTLNSSVTKTPNKALKKRKGVTLRYIRKEERINKPKQKSQTKDFTPNKKTSIGSNRQERNDVPTPKSTKVTTTNMRTLKRMNSSTSTVVATTTANAPTNPIILIPTDKTIAQNIGMRLRNLLKLPKAHKWVIFEWFYSFIDKPLFESKTDFDICLSESFPKLATRHLTRAEWQKIRSFMGKPRRCSAAFFEEERRELERKRQKIRYMQTRRSGEVKDANFLRDLPEKIPLPLPLGTKVTARLREPQDGIFGGAVDAFDSLTSTYRIKFDRPGLGTHTIPDYEIVSENFHEMLPLQSITKDYRPSFATICSNASNNNNNRVSAISPSRSIRSGIRSAVPTNLNKSDPVLGEEFIESPFKDSIAERQTINGYPRKMLETLVRLKRAISIKRSKLLRLSDMNDKIEMNASQHLVTTHASAAYSSDDSQNANGDAAPQISEEFQRRYASIIISLDKVNRDVQDYLNEVQEFATELAQDPQVHAMLSPSHLREKCLELAEDTVKRNNHGLLKNKNILNLIKKLATVLLVASHLDNNNSAETSKILEGCMEEARTHVNNTNIETFQKHIQLHLHHIRLGIGQNLLTGSPNNNNHASSSPNKSTSKH